MSKSATAAQPPLRRPRHGATLLLRRGATLPASMLHDHSLGVLASGILRQDLRWAGSRPRTLDFLFPDHPIAAWLAVPPGSDASVDHVAVEDCSIRFWTRAAVEAAVGELAWLAMRRDQDRHLAARGGHRLLSLLRHDAGQRYRGLCHEFPAAWQRVPQHMLASYLGVTPQYICRLKQASAAAAILPAPP